MPPIDPTSLLKAFEPWLTPEGGIKNVDEVIRLSSLMKKYSKKLVSRCIYLNVLIKTKQSVLDKFLEQDGWETINSWLTFAKDADNTPFLLELLTLLDRCPVNVDRLKKTNTAKVLKVLSKEGEGVIAVEAKKIVDKWKSEVIGCKSQPNGSVDVKKPKPVNPKRHKSTSEEDGENKVKRPRDDSSTTSTNKSTSNSVSNKVNGVDINANNKQSTDTGLTPRAPTVKVRQNTMRSVGVLESLQQDTQRGTSTPSPPLSNRISGGVTSGRVDLSKPSMSSRAGGDNRVAPIKITMPSATNKTPTIKVIDPLPLTPPPTAQSAPTKVKVLESNIFMESLTNDSPEAGKRKKQKVSHTKSPTDSSLTKSTDIASANASIDDADDLVFDMEEASQGSPSNSRSSLTSTPMASSVSNIPLTPGPSKSFPRGCLSLSKSSKRKSVQWIPDSKIRDKVWTDVRMFDVDDTERTNVYKDAIENGKRGEANAFRHKSYNLQEQNGLKQPIEYVQWRLSPIEIVNGSFPQMDWTLYGKSSLEREIQSRRQSAVMVNFMDLNTDAPAEADPESHEYVQPKTIPFEPIVEVASPAQHAYVEQQPMFQSSYQEPPMFASSYVPQSSYYYN